MATAANLTKTEANVLPCDPQHCQTPDRRFNRSLLSQSDGMDTPPNLTPSSEVSELEIESPATPGIPTKSTLTSRFLETCIPLKIERRILQAGEDAKEVKKPLWDISVGDTSTKAWLFKQCSDLETWTAPGRTTIPIDIKFSGCSYEIPQLMTASSTVLAPVPASIHVLRLDVRANPANKPSRSTTQVQASNNESCLKEQFIRALPTDVVTRLFQDPYTCVAQTVRKPYRRCTKKIPGSPYQSDSTVEAFNALVESQDLEQSLELLDRLLKGLYCNSGQHLRIAKAALHSIQTCLANATTIEAPGIKALVLDWLKGVVEDRPVVNEPAKPRLSQKSSSNSGQGPVKPEPRRSVRIAVKAESSADASVVEMVETTTITYVPYYDVVARNSSLTPSQLINLTLDLPLKQKDRNDGYLYVFWRQGDFGLVKIGHTTKTQRVRLDAWRKKCGGDNQGCGDVQDKSPDVRVRNVRRLESLVHAELKQYRRIQLGCPCGVKKHIEWFAVDLALVSKVVEKWTNWLGERPRYEDKVGGGLLPLTKVEREELCSLVELPVRQSVESPATQRRRSSRLKMKREQAEANLGNNPWSGLGPTNIGAGQVAAEHDTVPA